MEFKINSLGFWTVVILSVLVLIPSLITYIIYITMVGIGDITDFVLISTLPAISIGLFVKLFILAKIDLLSTVEMDEKGIVIKCFGKTWLEANWNEFPYIGEVFSLSQPPTAYIYFSRYPLEEKDLYKPSNKKSKGDIVFIRVSFKSREAVQKYVDENKIIPHESIERHFGY